MTDLPAPPRQAFPYWPVEFSVQEREIITYVLDRGLTMVSPERMFSVVRACRWITENEIPGDFVECGVWRGGVSILASLWFQANGVADRSIWLYDTFSGMTEPQSMDRRIRDQKTFQEILLEHQKQGLEEDGIRAYAGEEQVRLNFQEAGIDAARLRFIRGDVTQTLAEDRNLPDRVAILRLDTDWYASTLAELQALYPRLSQLGVLLIDDYGYYEGSRRAVDKYFETVQGPLLFGDDEYGRVGVKHF